MSCTIVGKEIKRNQMLSAQGFSVSVPDIRSKSPRKSEEVSCSWVNDYFNGRDEAHNLYVEVPGCALVLNVCLRETPQPLFSATPHMDACGLLLSLCWVLFCLDIEKRK